MNLFAVMSDVGWTLWGAIQAKISTIDYDFTGLLHGRWARAVAVMDTDRFQIWLREAAGYLLLCTNASYSGPKTCFCAQTRN